MPGKSVCYLRMENLEFLSRPLRYADARALRTRGVSHVASRWLLEKEKIFHLPGSELLLVLTGPETEARLQYMLNVLITAKFTGTIPVWTWNTAASWGTFDGRQETLQPAVGAIKLAGGSNPVRTVGCLH
ncbi:protein YfeA [Salmonella enterica subsp. enterica]|uniref:Protein YfeA n=1 Tax=Salmonella enterica I TaxID=59201 RepID=A0A3S4HXX2_SALET|nr:protein YfeA [Salmonella enterica subsp. enterica]